MHLGDDEEDIVIEERERDDEEGDEIREENLNLDLDEYISKFLIIQNYSDDDQDNIDMDQRDPKMMNEDELSSVMTFEQVIQPHPEKGDDLFLTKLTQNIGMLNQKNLGH